MGVEEPWMILYPSSMINVAQVETEKDSLLQKLVIWMKREKAKHWGGKENNEEFVALGISLIYLISPILLIGWYSWKLGCLGKGVRSCQWYREKGCDCPNGRENWDAQGFCFKVDLPVHCLVIFPLLYSVISCEFRCSLQLFFYILLGMEGFTWKLPINIWRKILIMSWTKSSACNACLTR